MISIEWTSKSKIKNGIRLIRGKKGSSQDGKLILGNRLAEKTKNTRMDQIKVIWLKIDNN